MYSLDDKYTQHEGKVLLTGVQALMRVILDQRRDDMARGLKTAGFISGYRGSPLAGFDLLLQRNSQLLKQHDIVFKPGVNEDLAATMIWGSQIANLFPQPKYDGVIGLWYGKAPGVDRSGDIFKHANLGGVGQYGGVLVVAGDDPLSKSSTLPSRSDIALYDANMPVLAPANVQDVLDFGRLGYALSRYSGLWVGFKLDTHICDEFATAEVGLNRFAINTMPIEQDGRLWRPTQTHTIGMPGSMVMEQEIHEGRLRAAEYFANVNGLNRVTINPAHAKFGIVVAGKLYFEVKQALQKLGLNDAKLEDYGIRILKLGMVFPIDKKLVREFARDLHEILVVEDKRAFVELFVRDALYAQNTRPNVLGKYDDQGHVLVPGYGCPDAVTLMPIIAARLRQFLPEGLLEQTLLDVQLLQRLPFIQLDVNDAQRTAYFCSGCPHNRSTILPFGSIGAAGIGCHGLVYAMGRTDHIGLGHMGGEGAQWVGAASFTHVPHLFQNLGDGTLFHSGSLAIRQAVVSQENITYKILYNSAVGMTGGQVVDGEMSVPALTRMLQAEGVKKIIVTTDDLEKYKNPSSEPSDSLASNAELWHRDRMEEAQRVLREIKGTTALIHDQMCAAEKRRLRKRRRLPDPSTRVYINTRVCEGCGDCGTKSNCLSVQPIETEFGRKTHIHQSSCNKDYSCLLGDCPAFVTANLKNDAQDSQKLSNGSTTNYPFADQLLTTFNQMLAPSLPMSANVYMMGIGGTGVVTVSQILGTAAVLEGKYVDGMDQTGLSQKGGAVVSHLKLTEKPNAGANLLYAGDADVYLAFDMLTATRAQDLMRASAERTVAIVSTSHVPTGGMVRDVNIHYPKDTPLINIINQRTRCEANVFLDAQALAEHFFGDYLAANMIVVGAAFQKGLLPISAENVERAIKLNGASVDMNVKAFRLGRLYVLQPEKMNIESSTKRRSLNIDELVAHRMTDLTMYQSAKYARRYAEYVESVRKIERKILPNSSDITEAVARNLYKLMAYKDEYEVARLYLDPEIKRASIEQFGQSANVHYHLRPPFLSALGMKRKIAFGKWFNGVFQVLANMKTLRGTVFDVFGYAHIRKIERQLIDEYCDLILSALANVSPSTNRHVITLANSPDMIRGYEDVKLKNIDAWRKKVNELKSLIGI